MVMYYVIQNIFLPAAFAFRVEGKGCKHPSEKVFFPEFYIKFYILRQL